MKIWKLTLWKVSGVSDTIGHILLRQSLSTKVSESVNLSYSYQETPTSSTPPTTSTSSSSSSTSVSVPASVSHTPPTSVGPSGPPTGLSSPLSQGTFSSGTSEAEGETAAWTADLFSAREEQISSSKMTLLPDILRISTRRTWLIS